MASTTAASFATTPSARTPLGGPLQLPLVTVSPSIEGFASLQGWQDRIGRTVSFVYDHGPLLLVLIVAWLFFHIGRSIFLFFMYKRPRANEWSLENGSPSLDLEDGGPENHVIAGSDIVQEGSEPYDVTGHFSDLFIGIYKGNVKVAMKRLRIDKRSPHRKEIQKLEREASFWLLLKHPYILHFVGIYRANDHMYLVSPFMENGNLAGYIKDHPERERIPFLLETADAVAYLHDKDIVHGDIKARNILVSESLHAKLCDFGLAKFAPAITASASKGQGSTRWQSPEVLNETSRSFASDTYAFGVTISEILSGDIPFPHLKSDPAVLRAVMLGGERPARWPTHSQMGESYEKLWNIAAQCWDEDPEHRLSMRDVYNRLCGDYQQPPRPLGAGSAVAEGPWNLVSSFDPVTSFHPSCPTISSEIGIT